MRRGGGERKNFSSGLWRRMRERGSETGKLAVYEQISSQLVEEWIRWRGSKSRDTERKGAQRRMSQRKEKRRRRRRKGKWKRMDGIVSVHPWMTLGPVGCRQGVCAARSDNVSAHADGSGRLRDVRGDGIGGAGLGRRRRLLWRGRLEGGHGGGEHAQGGRRLRAHRHRRRRMEGGESRRALRALQRLRRPRRSRSERAPIGVVAAGAARNHAGVGGIRESISSHRVRRCGIHG